MSAIDDLILQISDPRLRERLAAEWANASREKKFGLVFENHLPELLPLHGAKPRKGDLVCRRQGALKDVWQIKSLHSGLATCVRPSNEAHPSEPTRAAAEPVQIPVDELLVVREFGEPIFPALVPVAAVQHGPADAPWHTLIEADNYHALQLLDYLYAGQVDCIYIDPPYNSGARDWKYNNDYVDGNDGWRHSKWLAMMQRRLLLAKRLLNPANSVLIVTIDEKEYLHLGLLLEQTFTEARVQMVSSVINPKGTARTNEFSRIDEYIFFVTLGDAQLTRWNRDMLTERDYSEDEDVRWRGLARTGRKGLRPHNPGSWYPIYVKNDGSGIHSVGDTVPLGSDDPADSPTGTIAVWPPSSDGQQYSWSVVPETLRELMSRGAVRIGRINLSRNSVPIYYLSFNQLQRIEAGGIKITGRAADGTLQIAYAEGSRSTAPKTVWNMTSHDAGSHGTNIIRALLPGRRFPFPKSLYAVEDALRFFVANKPNALILDFFAGSGTTAHAVMRLNHQDGGRRRCISVTNNEVAAAEQATFSGQGLQPGDPDWELWGICQHITFPRIKAAITGKTPAGEPIKGDYKFTDEFPMADGFAANLAYFRLDFLEQERVSLRRAFREILPLLWLKAGSVGPRPELARREPEPVVFAPDGSNFVVLLEEFRLAKLMQSLKGRSGLSHVFIVTDSDESFKAMAAEVRESVGRATPDLQVVQLYRDYLVNFMINKRQDAVGRAGLGAMPRAQA